uniref:DUF1618 domain-containing protein n=1 Tax=Oryza meridionalis TaxID=40149 RepID=A0A0E0F5P7_9ORYZ
MEPIGEHCSNTPCEWLLDLGKGGAHDTNAHHLFDGMPSQPEMSKEDRRIFEPVPINTNVNKEEKWLNEALDRILEKFEQMEVKRRCDEKIDRILEKLDEIEANRNKFCEEMSAFIKATTAALTAASYPPLQVPPSPTPTTYSMRCSNTDHLRAASSSSHIDKETAPTVVVELGDGEDKDHAPCIVTKDLPKITPARCSTLDLDVNGGTIQTVVAFLTMDSVPKVVPSYVQPVINFSSRMNDGIKYDILMDKRSLMMCIDVNTDIYHAVVVFPLMDSPLELITGFIEPSPVVELKLDSIIGMKKEVPNGCSMKCPKDDNKLLMENLKRNPWPPPWLDGVIRGRDLRPSPWPGFISGGTVEHLVPPWPPPTQINCLALVCHDNGMIFTEMKYINLHWSELKPWPPPNQSDFRHTMVQFEQCRSWKIGVIIGLLAWKKQLSSVNHGSYTTIGNSRMPKLTMEKRSYMLNASDAGHQFTPYMMEQYIEAIEHGLIDGNRWDANNVHDTYGCKERMSVTVILKVGTDRWKLKGIKKSAIKIIISAWKITACHVLLPYQLFLGSNTIVMLVGHHEYYGEGENTKLQLKIVLAGKSNGNRNDLITLIIRVLQVSWNPGGLHFQNFTQHRLEDKSDFKERGLLGYQLEWAFGLMLH